MKTGTLKELNVQPGDVVELTGWTEDSDDYLVGKVYTIMEKHPDGLCDEMCAVRKGGFQPVSETHGDVPTFRIIARASDTDTDTPKTWGEMTDAEKGALLLAKHEGKVIEYCSEIFGGWTETAGSKPIWHDRYAYRVKPEPVRETVKRSLHGKKFMGYVAIDLVDGEPDWSSMRPWIDEPVCDSIKMERI